MLSCSLCQILTSKSQFCCRNRLIRTGNILQSCVQLWWARVHCSLGFLIIAARCDTQYFLSCCCSLSASSWVTVTVFILVFVVTLMIRNTVEPCVKEMKWIILASSVFCICKCLVYCFFVCIALGGGCYDFLFVCLSCHCFLLCLIPYTT